MLKQGLPETSGKAAKLYATRMPEDINVSE